MMRHMLKSKLHRAVVTEANLDYIGSLTVPSDLLEQVDLIPNEMVHVVNLNTGARFETYIFEGERNSGHIAANGGAARLVTPGDRIIVLAYAYVPEEDIPSWKPRVVVLDEKNRISLTIET
jgi:aspartate 1-decarboxylase